MPHVGKGKGNKARRPGPHRPPRGPGKARTVRVVEGMAPDVEMPVKFALPDDHPRQQPFWQRVLEQELHAVQFLWTYINFVDDTEESSTAYFTPQRDDETPEEFQQRRDVARLRKEVRAAQSAAGSWAGAATDEMRHIRPSDARAVTVIMFSKGYDWCEDSGFRPTPDFFRDAAAPLLAEMCPPEHLPQTMQLLDDFWHDMTHNQKSPGAGQIARIHPIEAIHVTAAMTAGMYGDPRRVPDRQKVKTELLELNPTGPGIRRLTVWIYNLRDDAPAVPLIRRRTTCCE